MKIWVDGDACPVAIRDILCRAAIRTKTETTFVANHPLNLTRSPLINFFQVLASPDAADHEIIRRLSSGDLVITTDIPLANDAINNNTKVLSPKGYLFTKENISAKLATRNLMDTLRTAGLANTYTQPLSKTEIQQFANHLDKILFHGHKHK